MAGIIQQKMPKDPNLVAGYDAERIKLEKGDTVEGRIEGIVSKRSPLMTRAATQGLQGANRRGLLNTSMAIGEAENAVYGAALPIASQDAQTSFQSKALNQNAANTSMQFNAGNISDRQMLSADIEGRSRIQKELGQIESRLIQERGNIEKALQRAEGETRMKLLNRQGQIDTQLQNIRGNQAMNLQKLQGSQAMQQQRLAGTQSLQQIGAQGQQAMNLQKLQGSQSLQQIGAQGAQNVRLALLDRTTQTQLQNLRGTQAERLANIEAQNSLTLQTSQSAALLYSQTAASIGEILANPDIPIQSKQGLVNKQLDLLQGGMKVSAAVGNNQNLSNLLKFGRVNPISGSDTTWAEYQKLQQEQLARQRREKASSGIRPPDIVRPAVPGGKVQPQPVGRPVILRDSRR